MKRRYRKSQQWCLSLLKWARYLDSKIWGVKGKTSPWPKNPSGSFDPLHGLTSFNKIKLSCWMKRINSSSTMKIDQGTEEKSSVNVLPVKGKDTLNRESQWTVRSRDSSYLCSWLKIKEHYKMFPRQKAAFAAVWRWETKEIGGYRW